jgi:CrcB protein
MTWLFICLGAAVGAPVRYLTDRVIQSRHDSLFPWGTFTVNVVGSLILGGLLGAGSRLDMPDILMAGLGTGFCGALTTFSTFGYETVRLSEDGARLIALLNVIASITVGFAAAALGYTAGQAL